MNIGKWRTLGHLERKKIVSLLVVNVAIFGLITWNGRTASQATQVDREFSPTVAPGKENKLVASDFIPRVPLRRLSTDELVWSDELSSDGPLVLIFGSYSCPIFCDRMEHLNRLHDDYGSKGVDFYLVYIHEAHPDGVPKGSHSDLGSQATKVVSDRIESAGTCASALGLKMEVLVDLPTNDASEKFDAWPERVVITSKNRIVYAEVGSGPSKDASIERTLQSLTASPVGK